MEHPVRRFRHALNLSQDALSDKTGASKSKISRVENGHQDVDLNFLRKVAALTADDEMREALVRGVVALPPASVQTSEQEAAA